MSKPLVWVGIHDHADGAPRWLDSSVSYTWLRAFERVSDIRAIAYLREHHYCRDIDSPIRGVYYRFRTSGIEQWVPDIVLERPDLILYNVCYYADGLGAVEKLREALPGAVHVVRIHHQVNYLAAQQGFREFVNACDVAIAPTSRQVQDVYNLGFIGPVFYLPFGVNLEGMRQGRLDWATRGIDLSSAADGHPARNRLLVESVFENLRKRGRRVENFQGLTSKTLAGKLGNTKVFWQTSLTEASGSRILPEAMAAGCFPVVFQECSSTVELIEAHRTGTALTSGIRYDFATKVAVYPDGVVESLTEKVDEIICKVVASPSYTAPPMSADFDEICEIGRLNEILCECGERVPKLCVRRRLLMKLPVDNEGYAFNPAICRTEIGLLCIYRHVDRDGVRSLRRTILDDAYSAREFSVWSSEMKSRGCPADWYADPRIFRGDGRYFLTFNTGHSETPNNIFLAEIDASGAPISKARRLVKSDGRRDIEKNWGFFVWSGRMFALYSISPFTVLSIDFKDHEAIARPFAEHAWDADGYEDLFGELHGGAPPAMLGDCGFVVAQSNVCLPNDQRIYRGSLVVFEAVPPFRPLEISKTPLFHLGVSECQVMPQCQLNPGIRECLYPSGAVIGKEGTELEISYGINDYRSGIRAYAICDFKPHLRPINLVSSLTSEVEGNPIAGTLGRVESKSFLGGLISKALGFW
ncbi:MAG: hypothetical protein FWD68_11050 [Alphaproteobacteria bacterium]|nr:hypothetical protein [Alphaproteobacteria bacterium]